MRGTAQKDTNLTWHKDRAWGELTPDVFSNPAVLWFLKLTTTTSPYPHDTAWFRNIIRDNNLDDLFHEIDGNFVAWIGKGEEASKTLFLAHIDTADREPTPVVRLHEDGMVRTDGTTILGADNKAGVAILLTMMEAGVPGTYMFVCGEERGRIGSEDMARNGWGIGYDRAIQFDRYGTSSIITHQMWERSCSDAFADALSLMLYAANPELIFDADPDGIYTDSYSFHDSIPECTNISVGYYDQHTRQETQDLTFLAALADACILIPWNELPTVQGMKDREYKGYYSSGATNYGKMRTTLPSNWEDDDSVHDWRDAQELKHYFLDEYDSSKTKWSLAYKFIIENPEEATDILVDLLGG